MATFVACVTEEIMFLSMDGETFREELAGVVILPTLDPNDRAELLREIAASVRHIIMGIQQQYPGAVLYDGHSDNFLVTRPEQQMHHIPQACQLAEFTHLSLTGRVFPDGLKEANVIIELPPTIELESEKDPPLVRVHYRMPTNVVDL